MFRASSPRSRCILPRGCEPSGTIRERRQPRGRTAQTQRPARLESAAGTVSLGETGTMRRPCLLVTVRTGSAVYRRMFRRYCERWGLVSVVPAALPPATDAWHDVETGDRIPEPSSVSTLYQTVYEVSPGLHLGAEDATSMYADSLRALAKLALPGNPYVVSVCVPLGVRAPR